MVARLEKRPTWLATGSIRTYRETCDLETLYSFSPFFSKYFIVLYEVLKGCQVKQSGQIDFSHRDLYPRTPCFLVMFSTMDPFFWTCFVHCRRSSAASGSSPAFPSALQESL